MNPVLEGIEVIELAQVAAVPIAGRHLADFGANVLHIEHPVRGDSWRGYQAGIGPDNLGIPSEINYIWETFDRNKKSITIDISRKAGQDLIHELVRKADVFLTNMRPFEQERYNIKYDTLCRLNPGLIYGSLTAYGKKGAEKNAPGYDFLAYARAGFAHSYTQPGGFPMPIVLAAGDTVAGLALANGVMMALYSRHTTGLGQEVHVSLLSSGIYQLSYNIAGSLVTGQDYQTWQLMSIEHSPNALAKMYQTKDQRWLLICILQPDRYWSSFCKAIERHDLENDPRFEAFQPRMDNGIILYQILQEVFLTRTLEEWKVALNAAGLPWAPANTLPEVINDPQARANDLFVTFDHPTYGHIQVLANLVELEKTPATIRMPAPELGQHTEEVLLKYGYSWNDITRFKEQGVIG